MNGLMTDICNLEAVWCDYNYRIQNYIAHAGIGTWRKSGRRNHSEEFPKRISNISSAFDCI
jgi:hypothetical protein